MKQQNKSIILAACMLACAAQVMTVSVYAGELNKKTTRLQLIEEQEHGQEVTKQKSAPPPRVRTELPPSPSQLKYDLPLSKVDRQSLYSPTPKQSIQLNSASSKQLLPPPVSTPECKDMNTLATYSGTALADYLVNLPSYECTYGLFSLTAAQGATVYSANNINAIVSRLTQEANNYNANNWALLNTVLYLRAGYFLASSNTIPTPAASVITNLRAPIYQLINGTKLYTSNTEAPTTANEVWKLISNTKDMAYFLPSIKNTVIRFTNTASNPTASNVFLNATGSGGFTGALTILYYAHTDAASKSILQDISYATALNNFVLANKASMINTTQNWQLSDAANEAFRFMQYPGLLPSVKPMVKYHLANSSMTGADSDIWIKAASAVEYYDKANCTEYGTCDYKNQIANTVLKTSYTCSPTIKIRAQDMTTAQLQDSCNILGAEETYFHSMMVTNKVPVANDNNTVLELVVFDDYTNYAKYAGAIYGISTDNGGMYLEGNPAVVGNQARFIAHEASWLRPAFSVWNLEHEYVHYLDGRFDLYGDFTAGSVKPTVWWGEGLAEYLSHKNNYQAAIDAAKLGTYKISAIFGNTYSMSDYVNRAYRWGYMAVRFMNEKHRSDWDAIVAKFRVGDYVGYQAYIDSIGTRYDNEFATWVQAAAVSGEPPMPTTPVVTLPSCAATNRLDKNCSINNLSSTYQLYSAIILPAGAKNLKIFTSGGTGDVDLYLKKGAYPTSTSFDLSSAKTGNNEEVNLASPVANSWYYVTIKAKTSFSGITLSATYE